MANTPTATLFDRAPVPLWEVDLTEVVASVRQRVAGGEDPAILIAEQGRSLVDRVRVLSVNSAGCRLLGVTNLDEIHTCLSGPISLPVLEAFGVLLVAVTAGERHATTKVVTATPSGERLSLSVDVAVDKFPAGRVHAMISVYDVSQYDHPAFPASFFDLERAHRELAQITYAASHDIQEPLRMITSYGQLLQQRYHQQLDERADKYIRYMVKGAKRIRGLVRDLLSLSNITMLAKPSRMVDFKEALHTVLLAMSHELEASGMQVHVKEPFPRVMVDVTQVRQLLHVLLSNALKFRSERPPEVNVSSYPEGDMWRFAVQDNGQGFDGAQYGERIFELFRTLHAREQYVGNGAGLAIARKIVERHGGRIWAESRPDEGATFFFTLPGSKMN